MRTWYYSHNVTRAEITLLSVGTLHERLRIALDRNAELEMKVTHSLRLLEELKFCSGHRQKWLRVALCGHAVSTTGPFGNNLRTPAPQSPQRCIRRSKHRCDELSKGSPQHRWSKHPPTKPRYLSSRKIIKGIASIGPQQANLSTTSKQLSTTQNINQELMVQVAQLHTRQEKAEADARLAESQRQAQIEEQQKREREALGRQQETSTNAIVGELRRLREAVSDKDEIEKVLVGGFSSLVAAASPALAPRTRGDEEPNYFTAPAPGSPSVYATPAPVNFSREDAKRSGIASGLRRWHDAAADEVISAPAFNTVDQSSEKAPASSGEGDIQREMAWNKFAASLRNSRK